MLMLRRCCMIALLFVATPAVVVRSAHAELERSLLERTRGLLELASPWVGAEPRRIVLNGARLVVTTGSSELASDALLDHFQALCRRKSGGLHQTIKTLLTRPGQVPSLLDGVLRAEDAGAGMVACLDLGQAKLEARDWLERLRRFAETADPTVLGELRVIRVEPQERGSFFVAVTNEGPLPLRDMFPTSGDAPGLDFAAVPRPDGARRIFSAWQEQAGTAVGIYAAPAPMEQALERYLAKLRAAGWQTGKERAPAGAMVRAELLLRGGHSLVVQAQPDEAGSLLSVLPMDAGPGSVRVR